MQQIKSRYQLTAEFFYSRRSFSRKKSIQDGEPVFLIPNYFSVKNSIRYHEGKGLKKEQKNQTSVPKSINQQKAPRLNFSSEIWHPPNQTSYRNGVQILHNILPGLDSLLPDKRIGFQHFLKQPEVFFNAESIIRAPWRRHRSVVAHATAGFCCYMTTKTGTKSFPPVKTKQNTKLFVCEE